MERKYAFTTKIETFTDISTNMEYKRTLIWCDLCNATFVDRNPKPARVPDEILERSFMLTFINEHTCQEKTNGN